MSGYVMSDTLKVVNNKIVHRKEIQMSDNKVWYKTVKGDEEFYSCMKSTEVGYFELSGPDAKVIQRMKDIKKEYDISPHVDFSKYTGTDIYYADIEMKSEAVELPAGTYYYSSGRFSDNPSRLVKQTFRTDQYINVFDKAEKITEQIHRFLDKESLYKELNCLHKLSILMYGPPGDGKTSLLRYLVNTDERLSDAIVISITEELPPVSFIQKLNQSTPGRLKIFILEEITNLASTREETRNLLTFMDGEHSVDKCIILSTTNYPELLPKNIVERPSRIDKLYKMGAPSKEEARQLIAYYYKKEPTEFELGEITGKSTAFIKEICLNALVNEISLEESLKRVNDMFKVSSEDFSEKKMGIAE